MDFSQFVYIIVPSWYHIVVMGHDCGTGKMQSLAQKVILADLALPENKRANRRAGGELHTTAGT